MFPCFRWPIIFGDGRRFIMAVTGHVDEPAGDGVGVAKGGLVGAKPTRRDWSQESIWPVEAVESKTGCGIGDAARDLGGEAESGFPALGGRPSGRTV